MDYVTHCHPHCYLKDVATNTISNSVLQNFQAMLQGRRKVCGCSWTTHMYITYENKQVFKNVIDEDVQKMIGEKTHNYEVVAALVDNCDRLINELKDEQKAIIKIIVQNFHILLVKM